MLLMAENTVTGVRPHRPRPRRAPRPAVAAMIVAATLAMSVGFLAPGSPPVDGALANEEFHPGPGPFGAITVIGDSVMQGSLIYGPTIGEQLAWNGWGPVRVRAGVGYATGAFPITTEARATYWIERWRQEGWDPEHVVVNLGANDSGVCNRDLACAREAITHVVDAIGPGRTVWWPQITRFPLFDHQADTWNLALQQIADERADFFTWNWPAVMASGPFPSPDNTHLGPDGYRLRSQSMAREVTADLAEGIRTGGDVDLPTPTGEASELVPVGPVRVIDTREDPPGHRPANSTMIVDVSDHVPAGTTAVAAYVSATNTGANGFLTAYDCDAGRPLASSANYLGGQTRGAVAITPISATGTFCLYTLADADLLVDLQAAFVPSAAANPDAVRFTPLDTPQRLVDTRETGRRRILELDVPAGADVVAVSLTAVLSDEPGFLTAYPCTAEVPLIATVNHLTGEIISGAAFVPVSDSGTICIYSLADVDVTVDLTGTFDGGGDLVFEPVPPTRTIDTRDGTGGWNPLHGQYQTIDARVAPPEAAAVSGTLTLVTPYRAGFLSAWGCGDREDTANVTGLAGDVLANSVTTGISGEGRMCVLARAAGSTVFDTSGWWVPA